MQETPLAGVGKQEAVPRKTSFIVLRWDILWVLVSLQFLSLITDKQVLDLQEKVQDPALASKRLSKRVMH